MPDILRRSSAARKRDPFEVRLSPERRDELAIELSREVTEAVEARMALDAAAEYWWRLYEQGHTRLSTMRPWPDAADLTSYLGTENVDTLHALIGRAVVYQEPLWTVEGWGEAQQYAPVVEEFHQWKLEEERLQSAIDRVILNALIDPLGILETSEGTATRQARRRISARIAQDPMTGALQFAANGEPILAQDDQDRFQVASAGEPAVDVVIDEHELVRTGPVHKVVPFRDFYVLPGHARDRQDVWGYAKRLWRRMPELEDMARKRVYDKAAVASLSGGGERETDPRSERAGVTVVNREGDRAEKELWEVLVLKDLDGRGERWYLVTLHVRSHTLLRTQVDDLSARRYTLFVPFPRTDSVYGYSALGSKLLTLIEEHTAWRNMLADKASMALMGPILRTQGALWIPEENPLGPKSVIDVRDPREIQTLQLPDVPAGALEREREVKDAAQRVLGVHESALGTSPEATRTLGELQLVASQSFGRMQVVLQRLFEAFEDLFQIRHAIWQRVLAEQREGAELPPSSLAGLETRGVSVPEGRVTAEMLSGQFRGKPRGSVESANPNQMRIDFVSFIRELPALMQAWPMLMQKLQTPQAADAVLEEAIRVFRWQNRQALIGSPAGGASNVLAQLAARMSGPGMGPGMMPAGLPELSAPQALLPAGGEGGMPGSAQA